MRKFFNSAARLKTSNKPVDEWAAKQAELRKLKAELRKMKPNPPKKKAQRAGYTRLNPIEREELQKQYEKTVAENQAKQSVISPEMIEKLEWHR